MAPLRDAEAHAAHGHVPRHAADAFRQAGGEVWGRQHRHRVSDSSGRHGQGNGIAVDGAHGQGLHRVSMEATCAVK